MRARAAIRLRRPARARVRRRPEKPRGRAAAIGAAIAALLLLWWLWPRPLTIAPEEPAVHVAKPQGPRVLAAAPVALKRAAPPPVRSLSRAELLAAVRERAPSLQRCGGGLLELPLRLHLRRSGAVRAVEIAGEALPASLSKCVRETALAWDFATLRLDSDLELLVNVSLAPGA